MKGDEVDFLTDMRLFQPRCCCHFFFPLRVTTGEAKKAEELSLCNSIMKMRGERGGALQLLCSFAAATIDTVACCCFAVVVLLLPPMLRRGGRGVVACALQHPAHRCYLPPGCGSPRPAEPPPLSPLPSSNKRCASAGPPPAAAASFISTPCSRSLSRTFAYARVASVSMCVA